MAWHDGGLAVIMAGKTEVRKWFKLAWAIAILAMAFITGLGLYNNAWLILAVLVSYPLFVLTVLLTSVLGRIKASQCQCGFNLSGIESGVCPECGEAVTAVS